MIIAIVIEITIIAFLLGILTDAIKKLGSNLKKYVICEKFVYKHSETIAYVKN